MLDFVDGAFVLHAFVKRGKGTQNCERCGQIVVWRGQPRATNEAVYRKDDGGRSSSRLDVEFVHVCERWTTSVVLSLAAGILELERPGYARFFFVRAIRVQPWD